MEKIIEVNHLRKVFKKEVAVENVCFDLTPGSIMGLLGTNGAGKTTTLKMITNLCSKDKGKIVIDGVSLDDNPRKALSEVGASLDTPSFYEELTAKENIEYFACLHKDSPRGQVMELLDYVGLGGQAEKKVKNFSLGMKQRLALARAMLGEPKIIILDEPANGLDPQGQISLYRMICHMARDKKTTFILSSHLLHDMEEFCTDILILDKGKSILQGKTEEILSETTNIVNRTRIIKSKVVVAVGMSIVFVILVAMINYVTAFMRWGYCIFETEALFRTVGKYVLSGIYMSCITLGIIAVSICTRSAWKTIVITIVYMILDAFIYSADILFLQKIWLGYSSNLWMFSYEYQRFPLKDAFLGIIVMMIYVFFFYQLARYKIKKIDF